jgi:phosphoribosylaminoimidazole carboxylase/phosphoribosylaminoimidazole-succinocarboxamide synthase
MTEQIRLNEGKTKIVWQNEKNVEHVDMEHKDVITAGDGKKRDEVPGKGKLSNQTASNVFNLLQRSGVPVAFIEKTSPTRFLAKKSDMTLLEVVVRREVHGSEGERKPHLEKGHLYPNLELQYFAKTTGKKLGNRNIPMDDPLLDFKGDRIDFYLPHWTDEQKAESKKTGAKSFLVGQKPFFSELRGEFFRQANITEKDLPQMGHIAKWTFLILEKALSLEGLRLVDLKVEFGKNAKGKLELSDVIDSDSWRVLDKDGKYMDKQRYRQGDDPTSVMKLFEIVADLTERFKIPDQQIILFRASQNDHPFVFEQAFSSYGLGEVCRLKIVTCSAHKEPVRAYREITQLVHEVPDSVIIAYVGRSNGLGPMLADQVTCPVITVPASWEKFAEGRVVIAPHTK